MRIWRPLWSDNGKYVRGIVSEGVCIFVDADDTIEQNIKETDTDYTLHMESGYVVVATLSKRENVLIL